MDKIRNCYEMAESLILYGFASRKNPQEVLESFYMKDYIDALGKDTVLKIATEVANSIDSITHDAYTDCEGCSYNSVKYKDGCSWRTQFEQKD